MFIQSRVSAVGSSTHCTGYPLEYIHRVQYFAALSCAVLLRTALYRIIVKSVSQHLTPKALIDFAENILFGAPFPYVDRALI